MFCSSGREALDEAAADVTEEEALVDEVVTVETVSEVVELRFLDLASSSRFSSSRSFWICFCWISERLKNFLPPVSSARDWRFLRSSCFRRSILGFWTTVLWWFVQSSDRKRFLRIWCLSIDSNETTLFLRIWQIK